MKILEVTFTREIKAAPAVIIWNYWDHEHLYVVHKNYTSAFVLYEDEKIAINILTYKLPVFSFLRSNSLNVMVVKDKETIKAYNIGLFSIPACTTIHVKEIRADHCVITMTYKFVLSGWRKVLTPFLPRLAAKWNKQVWEEDLPLKIRRQKVMKLGFKDFVGLPEKIEDRFLAGEIPFELPITRHKQSPVNLPL